MVKEMQHMHKTQLFNGHFPAVHTTVHTTTGNTLLSSYRTTCASQHPQLRTGRFCWSKVLLPTCPCWWHLMQLHYGEDARVLNGVTCTISVPSLSGADRLTKMVQGAMLLTTVVLRHTSACQHAWQYTNITSHYTYYFQCTDRAKYSKKISATEINHCN